MATDYDNTDDIAEMTDEELRALVRDRFDREHGVDPDDLSIDARDGVVVVNGRVGTEAEVRIADHILSDAIGIQRYENNLVVDPIRRAESPEAIDDHLADEEEHEGLLLGDRAIPLSPEAEHLDDSVSEQMFGTTDVSAAIESAAPWVPPESPTPEGYSGTGGDAIPGEDH